jgi:hypothetical protein
VLPASSVIIVQVMFIASQLSRNPIASPSSSTLVRSLQRVTPHNWFAPVILRTPLHFGIHKIGGNGDHINHGVAL